MKWNDDYAQEIILYLGRTFVDEMYEQFSSIVEPETKQLLFTKTRRVLNTGKTRAEVIELCNAEIARYKVIIQRSEDD
jgi:hypothetical protein